MPFRITSAGDIVRGPEAGFTARPNQTLDMLLSDPAQRDGRQYSKIALDAGLTARKIFDRAGALQLPDRLDRIPVAPVIIDYAKDNPGGIAGQFLDRAVDALIATALGAAASRSWSIQDSRFAFVVAFGLDRQSRELRDQLLGAPVLRASPLDDSLPASLRDRLLSVGFRFADPTDPPVEFPELGRFDDLFQRTCVLGVFDALHEFGRALADAPRENSYARISKLEPDHGCTGDRIKVRGTGFGKQQAAGLDLVFPAERGGWLSVEVAPSDWSDTEITVTLPAGVGVGPVGFVQVNPTATPATEAAGRVAGEIGACFGPIAQARARTTFEKLGGLGKVSITETPFNRFRGGPPRIDYFLANGAQKAVVRPGGPLLLQWSVINADKLTLRKAAGAPAELPPIPAGMRKAHDEISYPALNTTGTWSGNYEIVAKNACGEVTQIVEVQMRTRKALALAGGGSKGAFEVGAVRCLYDAFGYQPDLLAGASVGALNATKLAEGAGSLPQLEKLWLDMMGPTDLFYIRGQINTILSQLDPGIKQALQLTPLEDLLGWSSTPTSTAVLNLNIAGKALGFANSGVASMAGAGALFTVFNILMSGLDLGIKIRKIYDAIEQLLQLPSLLLFNPVRDKIAANIDPSKVANSGLALRIVVNGLRTAKVRYVDESGAFVDGGPAPGVVAALTASASIPIAFPPVQLPDGEDYVDGGVLENAPIEAAVRAGADSVIAILPSPAEIDVPSSAPTALLPVAERAVGLLLDGSSRRQLEPFRGWGVPVKVIAPRVEPHNLLVVDPGLIRINMDYGYMRAYDEMQSDDSLRAAFRNSSDAIMQIRQTVWYQEHAANGQYPKGFPRSGELQPTGDAEQVEWIREKKREIRDRVLGRAGLGGGFVRASVPSGIDKAWLEWEAHFFDTFFATPWNGYSSYPGKILQAETPPAPLP